MTQHLHERYESWIGLTVNDAAGHKIGKVDDIYTDDDTGQPEWLAIVTGLFGSNVSFVPVAGAAPTGDDLQVQFPKDQVRDAPNAGSDGVLSEEEEARLYAHYGLDYDQERVRLQRWVERESVGAGAEMGAPVSAETDAEMRRGHEVTPLSDRPGSTWAHDEEIDDDHEPLVPGRTEPVEVGSEGFRR